MKAKVYIPLLIFMAILTLPSCQDEIKFPDPGFDLVADKVVEVRRDTADTYMIELNMHVPNGVNYIEVIDGVSQQVIDSIVDYNGKKEFRFQYSVDLTPFDMDTTLSYIINVIDKDHRSFNKGMQIKVLKFSFPELHIFGGDKVGLAAPSYYLKGLVTTGLNTIDSIKVTFDGREALPLVVPDSAISEYVFKDLIVVGALQEGIEYKLRVDIYDNKGQHGYREIILVSIELQKPTTITYFLDNLSLLNTMRIAYDEKGRIDSITYEHAKGTHYKYHFTRNEMGLVDSVNMYYYYAFGEYSVYISNRYEYQEGSTKLNKMYRSSKKVYDTGAVEDEGESVLLESVQYREDGTIYGFVAGAQTVKDLSYAKGFAPGETIFAEYYYTSFYKITNQYRQRRIGFEPIFMPTYMNDLPPFLFIHVTLDQVFNDLLFHRYVFTENERINDKSYIPPAYGYTTDSEGRISTFTKIIDWYGTKQNNIFTFYYE